MCKSHATHFKTIEQKSTLVYTNTHTFLNKQTKNPKKHQNKNKQKPNSLAHLASSLPHRVERVGLLVRLEGDVAGRGHLLCPLLPVEEEQVTAAGFEPKPLSNGQRCFSVVILSINVSTCDGGDDDNTSNDTLVKRMSFIFSDTASVFVCFICFSYSLTVHLLVFLSFSIDLTLCSLSLSLSDDVFVSVFFVCFSLCLCLCICLS